jgi:hypothetical protein
MTNTPQDETEAIQDSLENEELERQKALLEEEYLRIRQLPHKIVNGIPIALTDQEIEEFNRKDPNQDAIDLELKKNSLTKPREEYLKNTDWYVAREADQPGSYPIEVRNKRTQAREEINAIQSAENLEQLDSFAINFS